LDDDARLGCRLAAGEPEAFEQTYGLYGPGLFRFALRMLNSAADAEDAVQEVFAALAAGRRSLADVADLKAYVFTVMRNTVARMIRFRKRVADERSAAVAGSNLIVAHEADVAVEIGFNDPEVPEDVKTLWRLVGMLPVNQRDVIMLKILGDLTFAQIAKVCGTSPHTAAGRYRYGLEKLRRKFKK
jgi:RNA polymerase sigma-70 factor, ECF subfamily